MVLPSQQSMHMDRTARAQGVRGAAILSFLTFAHFYFALCIFSSHSPLSPHRSVAAASHPRPETLPILSGTINPWPQRQRTLLSLVTRQRAQAPLPLRALLTLRPNQQQPHQQAPIQLQSLPRRPRTTKTMLPTVRTDSHTSAALKTDLGERSLPNEGHGLTSTLFFVFSHCSLLHTPLLLSQPPKT
jgi:hypothetical protein